MNSLSLLLLTFHVLSSSSSAAPSELLRGYKATLTTAVQPLLVDPTGNFSLIFLRHEPHHLTLAVVHIPSGDPLWTAQLNPPAKWHHQTHLTFNGSIVISNPLSGAFWSTNTPAGDRVVLSNTSNLQILPPGPGSGSPLWQSFDFPSDTLVESQNLTSNMTLISSNHLYTLKLGPNFISLYAKFNILKHQIYYRHTAMEARAKIIPGQGPIHIRVSPDGYLGMYQKSSKPADLQPFNSYQRSVPGIRRIRLEPDGNLKGYYWSGSEWVLDYQAISETCELPSTCGPYGLCWAGSGCTCLDDTRPGECYSGRVAGDLCKSGKNGFTVLRKAGVELPYKEEMGFTITTSFEECERACESNCTCWGALYSSGSGYCYALDYPAQTLVAIGDLSRVGYFKVRAGAGSGRMSTVAIGGTFLVVIGAVGFGGYRVWKRKRGSGSFVDRHETYKRLTSESRGSIELS